MKVRLSLFLMMLGSLVSCGSIPSTIPMVSQDESISSSDEALTSFEKMYQAIQSPLEVSGTKDVVYEGTVQDIVDSYDITLQYGEKSFHYLKEGESGTQDDAYWTEDGKQVLDYYINSENEVASEVCVDDETGEAFEWKNFSNPFKYVNLSIFTDNGNGTYSVEVDNDLLSDDYNYLASDLTREDFISLYNSYDSTFESITLYTGNGRITGIDLLSSSFTDSLLGINYHYEFNLNFTYYDDLEYPLPTPYESMPYHDNLRKAINYLVSEDASYSVSTNITEGKSTLNYYSVVESDLLYNYDVDSDIMYGYIQKEGYVHQIVRTKEMTPTYGYSSDYVMTRSQAALQDIKRISPFKAAPIECFTYDSKKDEYHLDDSSMVGLFSYAISPYWTVDERNYYASSLVVKLDDNQRVESMSLTSSEGYSTVMNFDYDSFDLPFEKEKLEEFTIYDFYRGTYTFTMDSSLVTLVISKGQSITWNGEACEYIMNESTMGSLVFSYKDEDYIITSSCTRISDYNNNSYDLTRIK